MQIDFPLPHLLFFLPDRRPPRLVVLAHLDVAKISRVQHGLPPPKTIHPEQDARERRPLRRRHRRQVGRRARRVALYQPLGALPDAQRVLFPAAVQLEFEGRLGDEAADLFGCVLLGGQERVDDLGGGGTRCQCHPSKIINKSPFLEKRTINAPMQPHHLVLLSPAFAGPPSAPSPRWPARRA